MLDSIYKVLNKEFPKTMFCKDIVTINIIPDSGRMVKSRLGSPIKPLKLEKLLLVTRQLDAKFLLFLLNTLQLISF